MSKAFVKDDHDNGDDLEWSVDPLLSALGDSKNYMTSAGFEDLRTEHAALTSRARTRDEDRRLRLLQRLLERAEVVEPRGGERVAFGSQVTIADDDGRERAYRIVGVSESRPEKGLVSWLSPIAKALLGARVGDSVVLKTPKGDEELTIVSIDPPALHS